MGVKATWTRWIWAEMPADIVNSGERFLGLAALREREKREEERGVRCFIVEGWCGGGARVSAGD
jgi:hypothetical protein